MKDLTRFGVEPNPGPDFESNIDITMTPNISPLDSFEDISDVIVSIEVDSDVEYIDYEDEGFEEGLIEDNPFEAFVDFDLNVRRLVGYFGLDQTNVVESLNQIGSTPLSLEEAVTLLQFSLDLFGVAFSADATPSYIILVWMSMFEAADAWNRDLTEEGVEPNPGPNCFSKIRFDLKPQSKLPEAMWDAPGDIYRLVKYCEKFELDIKETCKSIIKLDSTVLVIHIVRNTGLDRSCVMETAKLLLLASVFDKIKEYVEDDSDSDVSTVVLERVYDFESQSKKISKKLTCLEQRTLKRALKLKEQKILKLRTLKKNAFVPQMNLFPKIDLGDKTLDSVDDLTEVLGNLPVNFNVNHIVTFSTQLDNMKNLSEIAKPLCLALFGLGLMKSQFSRSTKVIVGLIIAYGLYKYPVDFSILKDLFQDSTTDFVPQSNLNLITSTLLGYTYYRVYDSKIPKGDVFGFMKSIGEMPKIKSGIEFSLDQVVSVLQKISDFFTNRFNMERCNLVQDNFPEIDAYAKDVNAMITFFSEGALFNYDNAQNFFSLVKRGQDILINIPKTIEFAETRRVLTSIMIQLKPLTEKFSRANITGNGPRAEPLGLMIVGPTGAGKSTIFMPLMLEIMALVLPESEIANFIRNHNDQILNRIHENGFHDGNHGQLVWFVDDLGQTKDMVGVINNVYMECIRALNTANWRLDMAHLDNKGTTNFSARFVVATSNRVFFRLDSIYDTEAFTRRFKFCYLMVPDIEHCIPESLTANIWDRRLNIESTDGDFDFTYQEFYKYDCFHGKIISCKYSYEEVKDQIVEGVKRNENKGDAMLKFHQDVKMNAIRKRFGDKFDECKQEPVIAQSRSLSATVASDLHTSESIVVESFANLGITTYDTLFAKLPQFYDSMKISENNHFSSFYRKMKEASKDFVEVCTEHPFITSVIPAMVTLGLIYNIFTSVIAPQSEYPTKSKNVRQIRPRSNHVVTNMVPQSQFSSNTIGFANKVWRRNMYTITTKDCDQKVLFIKGRLAILPRHFVNLFLKVMEEDEGESACMTMIKNSAPSISYTFYLNELDFASIDDKLDFAYVLFPSRIHNHPDISDYFISETAISSDQKISAALLMTTVSKDPSFQFINTIITRLNSKFTDYANYIGNERFLYDIPTSVGDCGSPLFLCDKRFNKPYIVGMHVAGNNTVGVSLFVTKEMIKVGLDEFDQMTLEHEECEEDIPQFNPQTNTLSRTKQPRMPTKNMVIRSPLYNSWSESEYTPSKISNYTIGDTLIKPAEVARNKYSRCDPPINIKMLEACTHDYISSIHSMVLSEQPWDPKIFSVKEAIEGVNGVEFCNGVTRKTSPGYPYNLSLKKSGKKDFFGDGDEYNYTSSECIELLKDVDYIISQAKKNIRVPSIYIDYLKDEKRKATYDPSLKAIKTKDTRGISAESLAYSIANRMYFGDFSRWMMTNRTKNGVCVGVNPYSVDWSVVQQHITSVGDNVVAGDFKNYDGSEFETIIYQTLLVIESYYYNSTDEDRKIRSVLFENFVNSYHLADGIVYEWFGSVASGLTITSQINSISNNILCRYAICENYCRSSSINHLSALPSDYWWVIVNMRKNVAFVTYGDDNIINISDEFSQFTNQLLLSLAFEELGMKYTNEDKSAVDDKFRSISEVNFLKRSFAYDDFSCQYMAPLALDSILESPYWTKTSSPPGSVEDTLNTSLRELALHPEDVYQRWAPALLKKAKSELGFVPQIVDQKLLRLIMQSQDFMI